MTRRRDRPHCRRLALAATLALLVLGTTAGIALAAWRETTQLSGSATADYFLPVLQRVPQINGTATDTETLTVAAGSWGALSGSATLGYQWYACSQTLTGCAAISGATGTSYVVPSGGAAASRYVVLEKATNVTHSATAASLPTEPQSSGSLAGLAPFGTATTVMPTISGSTTTGATLTATAGTWKVESLLGALLTLLGASDAYQWLRCGPVGNTGTPTIGVSGCVTISGATAATYTTTSADAGHRLRARITHTASVLLNISAAVGRVDTQATAPIGP